MEGLKEMCEELRTETGYSLMDCRMGLIRSNGDKQKAIYYIEKKLKRVLK